MKALIRLNTLEEWIYLIFIPQLAEARLQLMSDFSSRLYGKQSEIMQTYQAHGLTQNEAAEIDNLVWYFSELFKSELKLAIGPIERGGAGGGMLLS